MAGCTLLSVILAVSIGVAFACSQPEGWEAKMLEERAKSPHWVVYGTVISAQMPTLAGLNGSMDQEYKVRFEPLCWLKRGPTSHPEDGPGTSDDGAPQTGDDVDRDDNNDGDMDRQPDAEGNSTYGDIGFKNITVTEFKQDCVANDLKEGEEYVLFLRRNGEDMFTITDVNVESGAIATPVDKTFQEVHRGMDAAMKGAPEGECLQGVEIACFVGIFDKELCSKGVTMGVAAWLLIIAVLIAALGY